MLGAVVGAYAGLLLSLVTRVIPLGELSVGGTFTSWQWWWSLLPDVLQQPAVAVTRGAFLGMAVAALRWEVLNGRGLNERLRRATAALWLAGAVVGALALIEGADLEGMAVAAAGGAFTGAAVDQSLARWLSPARREQLPAA